MTGRVRTVSGDVSPEELGRVYCHEHLLTRPGPHVARPGDDLRLDDEQRALEELRRFAVAGGGALVEVTTPEFGRDAAGLARLAEASGVTVVCTTGHVSEEYWRGVLQLERTAEAALVDEFVAELVDGIDETGVRAGVIKAGTSLGGATPTERKVLRAAASAQRLTGAPITTHTTAGTAALEQVQLLEAAGASLEHVCIGHLDRRLVWDEHLELARTGVFLGYDCVSKEQYASDERRAEFIVRLGAEGFGDRVCLSGDLARRSYLTSWGGAPGYAYILEQFLPLLLKFGLSEPQARALVVDNPARLLTWA
jgi:predicted metal-dependent phosphotriesterase family hydrolase